MTIIAQSPQESSLELTQWSLDPFSFPEHIGNSTSSKGDHFTSIALSPLPVDVDLWEIPDYGPDFGTFNCTLDDTVPPDLPTHSSSLMERHPKT